MNDNVDEDGGCNKEALELLQKYQLRLIDDFKAKSWSDALDERDFENAKTEYETEVTYCNEGCWSFAADDIGAYDTVREFAYLMVDEHYADYGFDNGLVQFEIEKWDDDGLDSPYFEINFLQNNKPYYTLYVGLQKRPDGEWGILEVLNR